MSAEGLAIWNCRTRENECNIAWNSIGSVQPARVDTAIWKSSGIRLTPISGEGAETGSGIGLELRSKALFGAFGAGPEASARFVTEPDVLRKEVISGAAAAAARAAAAAARAAAMAARIAATAGRVARTVQRQTFVGRSCSSMGRYVSAASAGWVKTASLLSGSFTQVRHLTATRRAAKTSCSDNFAKTSYWSCYVESVRRQWEKSWGNVPNQWDKSTAGAAAKWKLLMERIEAGSKIPATVGGSVQYCFYFCLGRTDQGGLVIGLGGKSGMGFNIGESNMNPKQGGVLFGCSMFRFYFEGFVSMNPVFGIGSGVTRGVVFGCGATVVLPPS